MSTYIKNLFFESSPQKLLVILIVIFGVYLLSVINVVRLEYKGRELVKTVSQLEKEHNDLRIQLSEKSSLDTVLKVSNELSYLEIKKINYIEKPSSSPFAAR